MLVEPPHSLHSSVAGRSAHQCVTFTVTPLEVHVVLLHVLQACHITGCRSLHEDQVGHILQCICLFNLGVGVGRFQAPGRGFHKVLGDTSTAMQISAGELNLGLGESLLG